MTDAQALTISEKDRLAALEKIVEAGMGTFVDVGSALLAIRDEHLYRQDYGTFEHYVNKRWGLSRGRAYQLITAGLLHTQVDIQNERQARELKRLETPTERQIAWSLAKEAGAAIAPGKDVPTIAVKAAVEAVSEAKITDGNTDPGTGEMEAISARVTQEVYETVQRQRQHIRESIERKEGNGDRPRFTGEFTVYHVSKDKHLLVLIVQPDLLQAVGQGQKGSYVIYLGGPTCDESTTT